MLHKLKKDLIRDEGFRSHPYEDTVGKLTIGYGHNLTDKGISKRIANAMFQEAVSESIDGENLSTPKMLSEIMALKDINPGMIELLKDIGISDRIGVVILNDDIKDAMADLDRNIYWWRDISEGRQRALVNMCFNLGWPRLKKFKKMLSALECGMYRRAAVEALDSKWANQVGKRANRIAKLIEEG